MNGGRPCPHQFVGARPIAQISRDQSRSRFATPLFELFPGMLRRALVNLCQQHATRECSRSLANACLVGSAAETCRSAIGPIMAVTSGAAHVSPWCILAINVIAAFFGKPNRALAMCEENTACATAAHTIGDRMALAGIRREAPDRVLGYEVVTTTSKDRVACLQN